MIKLLYFSIIKTMSFTNGNDRAGIPTVDIAMDCISNALNKIKRAYNYDEIMSKKSGTVVLKLSKWDYKNVKFCAML